MATLTNTKIKDTYDGLLKTTNNEAIGASGVTLIEDGLGNASALSVGRSGNGATITGSLNATLATAAQPNITSVGTLSSLAVSGNLTVDTNTLYVDAANNSVGIGTSSVYTETGYKSLTINDGTYGGVVAMQQLGTTVTKFYGDSSGARIESVGARATRFFNNGSERMRIDSSGNTSIYSGVLNLGSDSVASSLNCIGDVFTIGVDSDASSGGSPNMRFAVSGSEKMRIDSSGNVSIGGSSISAYRTTLVGNGSNIVGGLALNSNSNYTYIGAQSASSADFEIFNSANGYVRIATNNIERMRITSGGNVLINKQTARGSEYLGIESSGAEFCNFQNTSGARAFRVNNINTEGFNASATAIFVGQDGTTSRSINAGGTINASGADYAEYMTKAIQDDISKGDVVGVDSNGLLTNIFDDAISFVVKSTNPSYVGGDTWGVDLEGDDLEIERLKVDRIAFSGQVPCNVYGANVGDYIIPVNDNGKISAQSVSNPSFDEYKLSVGKVWKIMEDGRAWIAVKIG